MKCVVINGTEVKGCTYNIKELFLEELQASSLVEFYLPKDGPEYCIGCKRCFLVHEDKCPHYYKVNLIWQAILEVDLIVFAYPVYALRAPGHIKSLLDHLAVHWFVHRPEPKIFDKRAVIITQSIGAPNKAAQNDVKTSLEWLGVPDIKKIGFGMMEGVIWEDLSRDRKDIIESKIKAFAQNIKTSTPKKSNLKSKLYFKMCKEMQKSVKKKLGEDQKPQPDLQHWIDQGWV